MFLADGLISIPKPTTFDLLASAVVKRALPVRFRLADSVFELEQVFRLRYQIAVEKGWAKAENFPEDTEQDAYDERAVHILALDDGKLIGTSRLVFPQPGSRLPTEEVFDLVFEPKEGVADIGRVCVARGYRGQNWRIFSALLSQTWIEMRKRGCTGALAASTPSLVRIYTSWKLHVKVLGPACNHWGKERYPVLICPIEF
jgi:N-acyl-L-homoserine lactone synthetase